MLSKKDWLRSCIRNHWTQKWIIFGWNYQDWIWNLLNEIYVTESWLLFSWALKNLSVTCLFICLSVTVSEFGIPFLVRLKDIQFWRTKCDSEHKWSCMSSCWEHPKQLKFFWAHMADLCIYNTILVTFYYMFCISLFLLNCELQNHLKLEITEI